jgi:hypothetical protein
VESDSEEELVIRRKSRPTVVQESDSDSESKLKPTKDNKKRNISEVKRESS